MAEKEVFTLTLEKPQTQFIEGIVKKLIDKNAEKYIEELQQKLQPAIIKIDTKEIKVDKTKHYKFKDVLFDCMVHKQVFLSGPTGK